MGYPIGANITYTAVPNTPGFQANDHTLSWSFDDSSVASGATTVKAWATTGNKTAIVTAVNNITGKSATASKTVAIKNPVGTLTYPISETKSFQSPSGDIFSALGCSVTSNQIVKLTSLGVATQPSLSGNPDASSQTAINYMVSSAAISQDGQWVVFVGRKSGVVPSRIVAYNTSTGVVKFYDFNSAISSTYCSPEESAMIVARSDNKFAVSVSNQAWQVPYTFIYDPVANTHSSLIGGSYAYRGGITLDPSNGYIYCISKIYSGDTIGRYDIVNHTWSGVTLSSTQYDGGARNEPSCIRMNDGKILMIGGWNGIGSSAVNNVAVFDPIAMTITDKASMNTARYWPACALLDDGRVVAIGGRTGRSTYGIASAEVYDPVANTWTMLSVSLATPRGSAGMVRLTTGNWAIIGGFDGSNAQLGSTEFYHPHENAFYLVD